MTNFDRYIIARWAYSIGEEFISDIEYDRLESEMKANHLAEEYISRGWSEDPCPFELLTKYNLDEFITPLVHSHSTESIESLNTEELVHSRLGALSERSRLSFKCDGFSLRLNYYDGRLVMAATRNRNEGKAIKLTSIFKMFVQRITLTGKVFVAGELVLRTDRFEEYKALRGIVSQRNGVSTAIANGDWEFLDYRCYNIYSNESDVVGLDKYEVLKQQGFSVPSYVYVTDYITLLKGLDILGRQKKSSKIPTDGCVLENSSIQLALRIGAWKEEANKSYVIGYTLNRGMYGNAVLCSIKPVLMGNKTQSEIPVTNLQTIIDNNLRIGYPIAFVERSAVNSVLDVTLTQQLQQEYLDRYDEYRKEIDDV